MPAEPGPWGWAACGCLEGPGYRPHPTSQARTQPGLAALTCRRPRAPLGNSTCVPAPGAAAADPGSCPAAPSPLLPDSEAAAPSGKLPASSRCWSSLPACARLLRGRSFPSSRQGAPEGRGVCATCAMHRGWGCRGAEGSDLESGVGADAAEEQGDGSPAVLGRRGGCGVPAVSLGMFTGDPRTRRAWLWAAPSPLASSWAGRDGQGARSRRLCASCPRLARPGGGGAGSHPGERAEEPRG